MTTRVVSSSDGNGDEDGARDGQDIKSVVLYDVPMSLRTGELVLGGAGELEVANGNVGMRVCGYDNVRI